MILKMVLLKSLASTPTATEAEPLTTNATTQPENKFKITSKDNFKDHLINFPKLGTTLLKSSSLTLLSLREAMNKKKIQVNVISIITTSLYRVILGN